MNYKTNGIVIKRQDFSEADRILTIFTERFGKVKAIARGVRKITARLAGSLEPFMLVDLQLQEGKTFYIITGASIINNFHQIHSNLRKMADAFYIGELIDKFESEHQKSEQVFKTLVDSLRVLDGSKKNNLILRAFEVRLLHLAGYLGDLNECLHCKKKIIPGNNNWDGEEGGLICANCQKEFHHGRAVSDNLIKLLKLFAKGDLKLAINIKTNFELEEAVAILSPYLRNVLESDIKSERFLQNVA